MSKPVISVVVAIGNTKFNKRVIGKDNKLLWRIPEDLKRFKSITSGHPIIMGRKTFESIGRPLPERTNIIVTRNNTFEASGCIIVHSLEDAFKKAREVDEEEIFVIGGGEIYREALPSADKLYLTLVESDKEGDSFFPPYPEFTKKTFEENGIYNNLKFKWVDLERSP